MKILFMMNHPGFARHFERALGTLCDEGHTVHIAFHNEKMNALEWTEDLRRNRPQVTFSVDAPRRNDHWVNLANRLRAMRDYGMYFDPLYADAPRLRDAAAQYLDENDRLLVNRITSIPGMRRVLDRLLHLVERAIPSDPNIDTFVAGHAPDLMLITPQVLFNSPQVDYVKSARVFGIPCAACVASWDNLTNKGMMRELPDRAIVWNAAQMKEAVKLHGMPRRRVIVTGAQTFDQWFEAKPSRTKESFLTELGLKADGALILYCCSSTSISPKEIQFVREWQDAVRRSSDPRVAKAAILVRPHPMNQQPWEQLDALTLPNFAVWPRGAPYFNAFGKQDYFDSLYHADVVVGLNTSSQVEAGLVGKPVLTLLSKDIPLTMYGTVDTAHFKHLLNVNGGLLHVARSYDEHLQHLSRAITGDRAMVERSRRFTQAFIRPHGLTRPATPILTAAIRAVADIKLRWRTFDRLVTEPILRPLLERMVERRQEHMIMEKSKKKKSEQKKMAESTP
jgi:hypothetical protein